MTKEYFMKGFPSYVPWSKLIEVIQLLSPFEGESWEAYLTYLHHGIDDNNLPFVLIEAQKLAFIVRKTIPKREIASNDVRTAMELLSIKPETLHLRILLDINHLITRLGYFSEKDRKSIKQSLIKTLCFQLDQVSVSQQQIQPQNLDF